MINYQKKVSSGLKWSMFFVFFTMISSYLTTLLLARQSKEIIGYYSLIIVFTNIVMTFVMFGSYSVLMNFLPKFNSWKNKNNLFYSYFTIGILGSLIWGGVLFLKTNFLNNYILDKLLINNVSIISLWILSISVVLFLNSNYYLNGILELKKYVIISRMEVVLRFFLIYFVFLFGGKTFLKNHYCNIILYVFTLVYLILFIIAFLNYKKYLTPWEKWHFPKQVVKYSFFEYNININTFLLNNIDKLMLIRVLDIGTLGIYHIIILIYRIIRITNNSLNNIFVSWFSTATEKDIHFFKKLKKISRYNILLHIIFLMSIATLGQEFLYLFGSELKSYYKFLLIILWSSSFESLYLVSQNIIKTKLKTNHLFYNSLITSLILIFLYYFVVPQYGFYGIIIIKGISIIILQIYPLYYYYKHITQSQVDKYYYSLIFINTIYMLLMFALKNYMSLRILSFIIFLSIIITFFSVGRELFNIVLKKGKSYLK